METVIVNSSVAVIGYGITGKSCVTFLRKLNKNVSVFVSDLSSIEKSMAISGPDKQQNHSDKMENIVFCQFDKDASLDAFEYVVVSPGVDSRHPALVKAADNNVELISEIELFARHNATPIIAVTGSNGKSTVVDMLHKGFAAAGINAGLGGNFGISALSLLDQHYSYIVLELSSFQLELTFSLRPKIACVLNVTEDHIDRHGDFENYARIKRRIFKGADISIVNRDDPATQDADLINVYSFGHSKGENQNQSWIDHEGLWLGNDCLLKSDQLGHFRKHNLLNLQVVLMVGKTLLSAKQFEKFLNAAIRYDGLPHRFEVCHNVVNDNNMPVAFIDDSKATNPGAVISAINSVDENNYLVLIVGGDAKKADLTALSILIKRRVDLLLCIGKDADLFMPMHNTATKFTSLKSLVKCAVNHVKEAKRPATVLLSPACSSIDMFENYVQRGKQFQQFARHCA